MYNEDRKRFALSGGLFTTDLPPPPSPSPHTLAQNTTTLQVCTSTLSVVAPTMTVLKPKPILVDKQASEPSSPIAKGFREPPTVSVTRRPMYRGFSDLGNRVKKKVTLSSSPYDGEVVIVVPSIEQQQLHQQQGMSTAHHPHRSVSVHSTVEIHPIDHEDSKYRDRDPGSPRTTTESSEACYIKQEEEYEQEQDDSSAAEQDDSDTTLLRHRDRAEIIISPLALAQSSRLLPKTTPSNNNSTDEQLRLL